MLNPELVEFIQLSYNNLFRINLASGIIFAVVGVAASIGSFFVTTTNGLKGFLLLIGIICIVAGLMNTYYYQSRHIDIAKLLLDHPQKIVWIYRQMNTAKVSGVQVAQFQFIVFGLRNKQRVRVRLPMTAVHALLEEVPTHFAHVTLGYNADLEKTFRQNPEALLRQSV